jgi:predicted methyltransferase MtxX (methanogen marker protein 4)
MTTQEWVLTIETGFRTKLREFSIDLEVIETESKDEKFFVEIFDQAIANAARGDLK